MARILGPSRGPGGPGAIREQGFTLLELVCVLVLLGLLMGLVLPGMQQSWQRARERANLRELAGTLRLARSEAATLHRRLRVFLDLDTKLYRLEASNREGKLTGMRVAEARLVWQDPGRRRGYIAFYADGSSSGGLLTLVDTAGTRHSVEVQLITGKVTLTTGGS